MNDFAIEEGKGAKIAGVIVPSETALKSKLLRLSERNLDEIKIIMEDPDGS